MVLYPDGKIMRKFIEALKKYMGLRGIKNPSDEQLGEIMFGSKWSERNTFEIMRMKDLWYYPGRIEARKVRKAKFESNPKEYTTFGHKRRTRIVTSLTPSEIYDVERFIVESERESK